MLNKVTLIGRVGLDPELRFTQGGAAILRLRVATSERWKDKNTGEKKEATEWHTCTLWGQRAEGLSRMIAKGDLIGVEGSIHTRSYEKDGVKRYSTEIKTHNVHLLTPRKQGGPVAAADDGGAGMPDEPFSDDNIPF